MQIAFQCHEEAYLSSGQKRVLIGEQVLGLHVFVLGVVERGLRHRERRVWIPYQEILEWTHGRSRKLCLHARCSLARQ